MTIPGTNLIMHNSLRRASQITALALLVTVATQILYVASDALGGAKEGARASTLDQSAGKGDWQLLGPHSLTLEHCLPLRGPVAVTPTLALPNSLSTAEGQ